MWNFSAVPNVVRSFMLALLRCAYGLGWFEQDAWLSRMETLPFYQEVHSVNTYQSHYFDSPASVIPSGLVS